MKILFGFAIAVVIFASFSTYTYYANKQNTNATAKIVNEELKILVAYEQLSIAMGGKVSAVRGYLLTGNETFKTAFQQYAESASEQMTFIAEKDSNADIQQIIERTNKWTNDVQTRVFDEYDLGKKQLAIGNATSISSESTALQEMFETFAIEREDAIEAIGDNIIERSSKTGLLSIFFATLVTIISIIVATITARIISKPINEVAQRMQIIADGDISQPPLVTHEKDEIGQLVQSTNEMNDKMHQVLSHIHNVATTVAAHSEELTQSANEVQIGSQQIAQTMQELADGAETQASSAGDLAIIMGSFATLVQETDENGNQIQHYSTEVMAMTNNGSNAMATSTKQMELIHTIVQDSVHKVEGLDAQSQEITKLVSVISDIAAQTNLLALNAAIEAARAGEHGQGFAVVADEVRQLAEQVSSSVTEISDIVSRIQTETATVASSLKEGYQEVEQGTNQIISTEQTFTEISGAIKDMVHNIQNVSTNLHEIATNSDRINEAVDNIAAVSEEAAAGVEQTAASVQQTASSMEEVTGSSNHLAQLAEQLNELVQRYKL